MSQSIYNHKELPVGDDNDQGQRTGDPASHTMPNHPRVASQANPTNSVGS